MIYSYTMRKDKDKVFELRKQGKSYREIQKDIAISRATLCAWFKEVEWSKHIASRNTNNNIALSTERIQALNKKRQEKLVTQYELVASKATEEYKTIKNEPLFMAGLMIYAGEGDKVNRGLIRISNSEFYLHKIFIQFVLRYLGIPREDIRCALIVYPDHNIEECIDSWSKELNIPKEQFHKTQVILGKEKVRKLQFGVGMTIISSTSLKKKIFKWLELCALDAGLV